MKSKKREIVFVSVALILQIILHLFCAAQKSYIHMDEAYSLGLSGYDKTEIYLNEDFYDRWHDGSYYEDYLCINQDELGEFKQVYENQKNDVHPPFYYLILRIAMMFSVDEYSQWPGIIINVVVYAFITVFNYLIFQRLFKNVSKYKEISLLMSFLGSITMASFSSVVYIRMYALATLLVSVYSYLHIKLKESDKKAVWFVLIGVTAFISSLTHYYLLFFVFALFIHQCERFIRNKDFKNLGLYFLALAIAAIISLAIFPYSIQHMFFGYQGEGFIGTLLNGSTFIVNFSDYLWAINVYVFNYSLLILVCAAVVLYYFRKNYQHFFKHGKSDEEDDFTKEIKSSLLNPTLFYFLIVSVASPWVEIRYVLPVCINIFVLVIYYLARYLRSLWSSKTAKRIMAGVLSCVFLVLPVINKQYPDMLYPKHKEFVKQVETDLNLPAVYMFNSQEQRFLDDILLFSKLEQSYIAKDTEKTIEEYSKFLKETDLSDGILLFINEGQNNDEILSLMCLANGFGSAEHIKRLNACDVYLLK